MFAFIFIAYKRGYSRKLFAATVLISDAFKLLTKCFVSRAPVFPHFTDGMQRLLGLIS